MTYIKRDLKFILDQLTLDQQERLFELYYQGNPLEIDFVTIREIEADDMVRFFIQHQLSDGKLEGESIKKVKLP